MASKMQHGYLVLADISGFTSFLAETELEHAHDILGELMEIIIAKLAPMLSLVEVEGDAVYVCAPETSIPRGDTLLELLDSTYAAFRDRLVAVKRRTTCQCNACRMIPTLDLKIIASCGDYILQSIAGSTKPVGSDVNLVHRLSKNHVTEATGWRAYALFTETTLEHMRVSPDGMHCQVESYEHLGEIKTFSFDLLARYNEMVQGRRVFIPAEEADSTLVVEIGAPPPIVWDWLNDPIKRGTWDTRHSFYDERVGSRRGVGTRNHCVHGKNNERIQTILDWRPFEYFTEEDRGNRDKKATLMMTFQLEPISSGTRLHVHVKMLTAIPGAIRKLICAALMKFLGFEEPFRNLARLIEQGQTPQKAALAAQAAP